MPAPHVDIQPTHESVDNSDGTAHRLARRGPHDKRREPAPLHAWSGAAYGDVSRAPRPVRDWDPSAYDMGSAVADHMSRATAQQQLHEWDASVYDVEASDEISDNEEPTYDTASNREGSAQVTTTLPQIDADNLYDEPILGSARGQARAADRHTSHHHRSTDA